MACTFVFLPANMMHSPGLPHSVHNFLGDLSQFGQYHAVVILSNLLLGPCVFCTILGTIHKELSIVVNPEFCQITKNMVAEIKQGQNVTFHNYRFFVGTSL